MNKTLSALIIVHNEEAILESCLEKLIFCDEIVVILDKSTDFPYPMPLYTEGENDVFVGRIRKSLENPKEINLWLSCDNLVKGAALNALQILDSMIKRDLIK